MDGTATNVTPLERELIVLARKAYEAPKGLLPADLDPLRTVVGDGALDYALVLGGFHFVNRIADLLQVSPEALPESLRRFEPLRRLTNRVAAVLMGTAMDLKNREYAASYEEAVARLTPVFERAVGRAPGDTLEPVRARPKYAEILQLMLEEREDRSSLSRDTLATVHRAVEAALPADLSEAEGFHERPTDPLENFAFVGTRYAVRTTEKMIDALRAEGYDDVGILDLAIAVADANFWARLARLTGLPLDVGYCASPDRTTAAASA